MKIWIVIMPVLILLQNCSGCSRSGRFRKNKTQSSRPSIDRSTSRIPEKTTIRMTKEGGIYKIPVKINGADMLFIFDTGASMISISNVEASFLYKQGTLTEDDVVGKADFVDANGNISPGIIISLKQVTIGNRTVNNVKASVVNNRVAPLLFGQSALEQFGNFSIDYKNSIITFE